MVIECEFAFRLAHDLPARDEPYTREEVAAAVGSVHAAIEVVAGHIDDWINQDVWSVIADNGTDGAVIVGDGTADWRDIDLPHRRRDAASATASSCARAPARTSSATR